MTTPREPNFGYLLAALISFLIIGPLATDIFGRADSLVLLVCLNGTLLIGIFSLQESRTMFHTGIGLAAISVIITIASQYWQIDALSLINLALLLVFMLASIYLAMRHLFAPGGVSFNRLMGGACIYIMLGMVWAILYVYIDYFDPDAFTGAIGKFDGTDTDSGVFWDLMYFGFVTMPALGYGDITPVAPIARVLAYLQAVIGQLYIAILIGSMVGSYISDRSINQNSDS
jgi:voltage-gated potassium channel